MNPSMIFRKGWYLLSNYLLRVAYSVTTWISSSITLALLLAVAEIGEDWLSDNLLKTLCLNFIMESDILSFSSLISIVLLGLY